MNGWHCSHAILQSAFSVCVCSACIRGSINAAHPDSLVLGIAQRVKTVVKQGVEVAIVVGGGNIFRGTSGEKSGLARTSGDYMGMMATVLNSLALQDALERHGASTRVMTAISMQQVAEPYIRRRAIRHLEKGRIAIFAAGTGNPYFSTDTAASLRAMEIGAEVIIKGTKVDGVYDKDPVTHPDAIRFDEVSYLEVLQRDLKVMDSTAISLCRDNSLPIIVFDSTKPGNTQRVICGEPLGTRVGG